MAPPVPPGRSFTVRGVVVGLAVGTVICAANVYFGLQTGWVSIMSMPASLMGFGVFKLLSRHLSFPFSPIENVLVQSVACGMAIMPLGCGLVGVVPAMSYLLTPNERGPINLSMWQLIIWSLGLCYFGVVFAVPLRYQVIIRERLRFPSGFSTAVLISILHGKGHQSQDQLDAASEGTFASLVPKDDILPPPRPGNGELADDSPDEESQHKSQDWAANMRLLLFSFLVSGLYTLSTYFFPILRNLPIFGTVAAHTWLWALNPSFAYIGQGIIMGAETTLHMTLGAVVGWAILGPLAKSKGWAPGPVDDWETGSKGWIVWISLAIMLVDAVVSLAYVSLHPLIGKQTAELFGRLKGKVKHSALGMRIGLGSYEYTPLQNSDEDLSSQRGSLDDDQLAPDTKGDLEVDAPPEQRVSRRVVSVGLGLSILFCIATIHFVFGDLVPLYATVISVFMALVLSIMGVRALGETDLNPVSGISKLAQLFFALIIPQSNQSSVLINLIAGAVGALQAGDLMQDLKTGHLLGAAPKAQFWGQVIGATFGAVLSAFIYRLYTMVYEIPGELFQVPTAYVWIFTARLVTGKGLPYMVKEWAIGAAVLFALTTLVRTLSVGKLWRSWIPGGIAVAVGMYNVPSFTLARVIGGVASWYWVNILKRSNTPLIILASAV
ncbi:putative membrane protein, oligopeptide transporter (OPT) family [Geosmithia morbida]|uniref:Membrane protein, oligopeptide transporter (OPT) family n=1 Tax=Geosmithia morbida TaxID=1094350 RepID=A0A9P4YZU3_9HYPO|nr:putative membrane protein, oligopeptide transporter (OPT) family [Geosmithia morbida]KAF4125955.1 putative membrane protein, oligopeptide transporter (OPT) family [Geosmithia morbida]